MRMTGSCGERGRVHPPFRSSISSASGRHHAAVATRQPDPPGTVLKHDIGLASPHGAKEQGQNEVLYGGGAVVEEVSNYGIAMVMAYMHGFKR